MICHACRQWAATTEDQWKNRMRNIRCVPALQPVACLQCGHTDWVTTRELITQPSSVVAVIARVVGASQHWATPVIDAASIQCTRVFIQISRFLRLCRGRTTRSPVRREQNEASSVAG
jgi:hypothetical protein